MTFEEWYKAESFKLMSSGLSVKEVLYRAYVSGWACGKEDKDYEC